jgi:hypothetical protein
VVRRKAARSRVIAKMLESDGPLLLDERAQKTMALREVPDLGREAIGHADVDELGERTVGGDDSDGAVPGTDELHGGGDDLAQNDREIEFACDETTRVKEAAKPALRRQNLLRGGDEFADDAVELGAGSIRKGEWPYIVGHLDLHVH